MKIPLHPVFASILAATLMSAAPNPSVRLESSNEWVSLFDGTSLNGWRASEMPGTFSVKDGSIIAKGPRSHLYYVGPAQPDGFKNFELNLEVKTYPRSNSGVYFHTTWQETGFPRKGYEVQVNNSHKDANRTGGLHKVQNNPENVVADGEWFILSIRVEGKHIVTKVGNKVVIDYTEEAQPVREADLALRRVGTGTFALQGHDPDSEVHFRNIRVRVLP